MVNIYRILAELNENGEAAALCTIMKSRGSTPRHEGSKMIVFPDGRIVGTVGGGEIEHRVYDEALDAIKEGKNRILSYKLVNPQEGDPGICGGQVEVLVEPIIPKPLMVVVGGGHVGKAVTHLAKWLGFRVAISDDRPEMSTPEEHPDADEFYPAPISELTNLININRHTYIVLTTRGIDIDIEGIPKFLETPAAYIGIIGSKRRWINTRKKLLELPGITKETLDRIHSPIGLDISAETPEEIAVSIMAEIIMLRNGGGSGQSMKI